jgi:hypothetical protein
MLSSISWLQYLLAMAVVVIGYYSIVIFIYYRIEIIAMLYGRKRNVTQFEPTQLHKNIMGETRGNANETTLTAEELRFSSELSNEENL